jgi:hypothetical protein
MWAAPERWGFITEKKPLRHQPYTKSGSVIFLIEISCRTFIFHRQIPEQSFFK